MNEILTFIKIEAFRTQYQTDRVEISLFLLLVVHYLAAYDYYYYYLFFLGK
jgi:hypothetical protein